MYTIYTLRTPGRAQGPLLFGKLFHMHIVSCRSLLLFLSLPVLLLLAFLLLSLPFDRLLSSLLLLPQFPPLFPLPSFPCPLLNLRFRLVTSFAPSLGLLVGAVLDVTLSPLVGLG